MGRQLEKLQDAGRHNSRAATDDADDDDDDNGSGGGECFTRADGVAVPKALRARRINRWRRRRRGGCPADDGLRRLPGAPGGRLLRLRPGDGTQQPVAVEAAAAAAVVLSASVCPGVHIHAVTAIYLGAMYEWVCVSRCAVGCLVTGVDAEEAHACAKRLSF
eukprot:COSAG01_NODE_1118_length_11634_cov_21.281838_3_plen_162_part_00